MTSAGSSDFRWVSVGDSLFTTPVSFSDIHQVIDGVMGTPVPYSIRNDNTLTILLLVCGGLLAILLAKSFPLASKGNGEASSWTPPPFGGGWSGAVEAALFLLTDSFLLSIVAYVYATEQMKCRFVFQAQSMVMLVFFALFTVYFGLKLLAYSFVNYVFFTSKKNLQWNISFFYFIVAEAVLLFPLVLLLVYFDLSIGNAAFFFFFILILNKMLAFYKGWTIFFRQKGRSLQIFLYFCALEIVPLLALGGAWQEIVNILKVNF